MTGASIAETPGSQEPEQVQKAQSKTARPESGSRKDITIRLADEADIDTLVSLGRQLHAEDVHSRHPYSNEKVRSLLARALGEDKNNYVAIVAERRGEIIGGLLGHMAQLYFSEDVAASAMIFYVTPQWRNSLAAVKLLHGFKRWAKAGNAKAVNVHVTSGVKMRQTDRLLKRLGFEVVGGNYSKGL